MVTATLPSDRRHHHPARRPPPAGFSKPVLSVHVSGTTTRLTVPPEFFAHATAYEFEVLALEAGGNQTISASRFVTQ
jgi:hypothetical protein